MFALFEVYTFTAWSVQISVNTVNKDNCIWCSQYTEAGEKQNHRITWIITRTDKVLCFYSPMLATAVEAGKDKDGHICGAHSWLII